jgi:hypothetical protein
VEEGKGGKGGDFQITNAEFIAAVVRISRKVPLRRCARNVATLIWEDGQPIARIGWPRVLPLRITTTSAVQAFIMAKMVHSGRVKPGFLRVTS